MQFLQKHSSSKDFCVFPKRRRLHYYNNKRKYWDWSER